MYKLISVTCHFIRVLIGLKSLLFSYVQNLKLDVVLKALCADYLPYY